MATKTSAKTSTQLDKLEGVITDADLARIGTFADLSKLFAERGIEVDSASAFGTGFVVLKSGDKDKLVNTPFAIVEWRYASSDKFDSAEFVIVELVTYRDEKYIFTDGSTGIFQQLKLIEEQREAAGSKNPRRGLLVERGLTRSDYQTHNPQTGELINGTTYYLAV